MPKLTPDRDDRQGNLAGQGGPQDGPIGGDDRNQQQEQGVGPGDTQGEGTQRHPGGSSRDTDQQG
jgi:hypothetical protein